MLTAGVIKSLFGKAVGLFQFQQKFLCPVRPVVFHIGVSWQCNGRFDFVNPLLNVFFCTQAFPLDFSNQHDFPAIFKS